MSKASYIFVSKFSLFAYFFILWIGATFLMYQDWSYLRSFQVMPKYNIWCNNNNSNHNLTTSTYIKNLEPVKILLVAFPRFELFWKKHFLYKYKYTRYFSNNIKYQFQDLDLHYWVEYYQLIIILFTCLSHFMVEYSNMKMEHQWICITI